MVCQLENAGLSFVGSDETGRRMEVCIILNYDFANAFCYCAISSFFKPRVWNCAVDC